MNGCLSYWYNEPARACDGRCECSQNPIHRIAVYLVCFSANRVPSSTTTNGGSSTADPAMTRDPSSCMRRKLRLRLGLHRHFVVVVDGEHCAALLHAVACPRARKQLFQWPSLGSIPTTPALLCWVESAPLETVEAWCALVTTVAYRPALPNVSRRAIHWSTIPCQSSFRCSSRHTWPLFSASLR